VIAFALPSLTLEIQEGDIAETDADAVVNAANSELWMGAGVAGALKRRGGSSIEAEAMAQGPIEPGTCVVTGAGQLEARHVIHAAVMGPDLRTSAEYIAGATTDALRLAEERAMASVAFPAFGTGVGGFPVASCARLMMEAVQRFAPRARSVSRIRFVLFGARAYGEFARVAEEMLGPRSPDPSDSPRSA